MTKLPSSKSIAAAFLGGIVATAPLAASAQTQLPAMISGTRLDITVRGEVRRVPDVASITAGVVTQASDAATAMRDNAARMARVVTALKKAGVAERDVATASISLSPQYRYADNQPPVITGYQASNQLTIRFRDIAKSGAILDILVKEGANQINGPVLMIDKPAAALDEARLAAVRQASARADIYARATGLRVKRIVSISEGGAGPDVPVPVSMMARSADTEAKSEVLPGEQAVGVTVMVVFELG